MEDIEDLLSKINSKNQITTEDEQNIRTVLRQRFLRLISSLQGKQCIFKTCENSTLEAEFTACDSDFQNIVVKNLKTPVINYEVAQLRVNDLISFHTFEKK